MTNRPKTKKEQKWPQTLLATLRSVKVNCITIIFPPIGVCKWRPTDIQIEMLSLFQKIAPKSTKPKTYPKREREV